MTTNSQTRWKRVAILASTICVILSGIIGGGLYLSKLSLSDHHNLYYLLWKSGLRDYDWTVVQGGILHDQNFRESLVGKTPSEFKGIFPNTFHEMESSHYTDQPNKTFYTDNYAASRPEGHQYGFIWIVVFENGKLVEFGSDKGI